MELTDAQTAQLLEQGYAHLPGVVPRELVERARRAINASLGERGLPPDDLPRLRSQSYCPELTGTPLIADLFNATPLRPLAEGLLGELKPIASGQIALRFPAPLDAQAGPLGLHVDGIHSPLNGVPEGQVMTFTALVGVYLADVPEEWSGNLTVWPGTHRLYQDYFRKHTPQALLRGMPPVDLPAPRQLTGQAGDAFLAHYLLGHGIAFNRSPNIRYAVFFRLRAVGHQPPEWECLTDIWREWAGLRAAV